MKRSIPSRGSRLDKRDHSWHKEIPLALHFLYSSQLHFEGVDKVSGVRKKKYRNILLASFFFLLLFTVVIDDSPTVTVLKIRYSKIKTNCGR